MKIREIELNGVWAEVGDTMGLGTYDTLVGGCVYTDMFNNIEDKGDYFLVNLAGTTGKEDRGSFNGLEWYDVYCKIDKSDFEGVTDIESFERFYDEDPSNSDFWQTRVEIVGIEKL